MSEFKKKNNIEQNIFKYYSKQHNIKTNNHTYPIKGWSLRNKFPYISKTISFKILFKTTVEQQRLLFDILRVLSLN